MNCREFEPLAQQWRSFAWSGGSFDAAIRPGTRRVEGKISLHHPTIITIVDGGCGSLQVISECGHQHRGPDFAGSFSFVPPACGRQLKMTDVSSEWASLSIRSDFFCVSDERGAFAAHAVSTFTNQRDPFLHAMLVELLRLHKRDGRLESLYCEAMAVSAAQYVTRRYGCAGHAHQAAVASALPGWRLRRAFESMTRSMDVMQVHSLDNYDQVLHLFKQWKEEGKIRYLAVIHWSAEYYDTLECLGRTSDLDFVQFNYSICSRQPEERLLPACADNGVAVLTNMPFEKARLLTSVEGLPVPEFAREFGATTWAQFFRKYVISHPAVAAAIPATSVPDHATDNMGALYGDLPDEPLRARMVPAYGIDRRLRGDAAPAALPGQGLRRRRHLAVRLAPEQNHCRVCVPHLNPEWTCAAERPMIHGWRVAALS